MLNMKLLDLVVLLVSLKKFCSCWNLTPKSSFRSSSVHFSKDSADSNEQSRNDRSVLIIGGGLSGLAAARSLLQQGGSTMNVTILESKDRLGGRLWSVQLDDNNVVDLGGMYWHGQSPILQLLQSEFPTWNLTTSGGTSTHPGQSGAKWLVYDRRSQQLREMTSHQVEKAHAVFQNWQQIMKQEYQVYADTLWNQSSDMSLNQSSLLLSNWSQAFAQNLTWEEREWICFQMNMTFGLDVGLSFEEMAISGLANDWDWQEYEGDDLVSVSGMQQLVDLLAADIRQAGGRIEMNQRVNHIEYSSATGCRVTTTQGMEWEADMCIVSLPLGVLKEHGSSMFVPPLPTVKQTALDRAGIGILNTIAVQWNKPICESNVSAYYIVGSMHASNPLRNGFVCSGMLRSEEPTITQFYLYETDVPFENLTYWKEQACEVVQDVVPFGVSVDDIVHLHHSRWHLDQDIRGSYSAPTTLTKGNHDRQLLAESVDGVLFFAGEHTNCEGRYQSMDGAYETGLRAAREILQKNKPIETSVYEHSFESEVERQNYEVKLTEG